MFLLNSEMSIVCGMTAHGICGQFESFESARHFRIEFESGRPIRIRFESRSFAGPYIYDHNLVSHNIILKLRYCHNSRPISYARRSPYSVCTVKLP